MDITPPAGERSRRRARDARAGDPVRALGVESGDGPDADPENVARAIALRKLAAAPQTRAQLDDAMARRGVPAEVRDRILDRFDDVGLINDAMFARMWVESRHAGRGLAKKALAHELRRRGIESALVDEAVAELAPEREEDTARALVARRLPSTRGLDTATRTRRLAGMLARKGYPPGLSYRVVREALEREGVDEAELPPDTDW